MTRKAKGSATAPLAPSNLTRTAIGLRPLGIDAAQLRADPLARRNAARVWVVDEYDLAPRATGASVWTPARDVLVVGVTLIATCGSKQRIIPLSSLAFDGFPPVPGACVGRSGFLVRLGQRITFTATHTGKKPWKISVRVSAAASDPGPGGEVSPTGAWISHTTTLRSPVAGTMPASVTLPFPAEVLSWRIGTFGGRVPVGGIAYHAPTGAQGVLELSGGPFRAASAGDLPLATPPLPAGTTLRAYPAGPLPFGLGWIEVTAGGLPPAGSTPERVLPQLPYGVFPGAGTRG